MVCRISIFMYECSQKNKEFYILQKKIVIEESPIIILQLQ